MKTVTFSLVFNRKNKLNKDGKALIQIRAYRNGKSIYFSTGVYIKPRQWYQKHLKVVSHDRAFEFNQILQKMLADIEGHALKLQKEKGSFSLNTLKEFWNHQQPEGFLDFYEQELKTSLLAKETKKKHKTAFNHLKAFRSSIGFNDLDFDFVYGFDQYLRRKGLKQNSIHTTHNALRRYVNLAIKKGLIDKQNHPYENFSVSYEKTDRTFLTKSELQKLEKLKLPLEHQHLQVFLDAFLFSCYTGLRFGDTSSLGKQNFYQDENGLILHFKASKTNKPLNIELYLIHPQKGKKYSKPEAIIQNYLDKIQKDTDCLFGKHVNSRFNTKWKYVKNDQFTNQYVNRELKKIAKLAGIEKNLTTHVARHSFATHMASKIPVHILQHLLQHSKIETTMIYVHMSNEQRKSALSQVDWE